MKIPSINSNDIFFFFGNFAQSPIFGPAIGFLCLVMKKKEKIMATPHEDYAAFFIDFFYYSLFNVLCVFFPDDHIKSSLGMKNSQIDNSYTPK